MMKSGEHFEYTLNFIRDGILRSRKRGGRNLMIIPYKVMTNFVWDTVPAFLL